MRLAHGEIAQDNRGCYNQIRAKDKELDVAAVQLEHARAVLVENKASSESLHHSASYGLYAMPCLLTRRWMLQLCSWIIYPGCYDGRLVPGKAPAAWRSKG